MLNVMSAEMSAAAYKPKSPRLKEGNHGMKLVNLQEQHINLLLALLSQVRLGEGRSRTAAFELLNAIIEEFGEPDAYNSLEFSYSDSAGMVIEVDCLDE